MTEVSGHVNWFIRDVYAHDSSLKSYLRNRYPTVHDVDDLVQESYLRMWRTRMGRKISHTKSFLFQVARNLAVDLIRRRQHSPVDADVDLEFMEALDDAPGVAEQACTRDELALLARAIDALPDKCRQVMILRQVRGMPQKEIADLLGISELTVQTHVVRGLRRCETFMREHGLKTK